MKDKQNYEIEELMNAYIDGEASQRQQTELKRLMLHDPALNQRIKLMQRQKQLVNALPVESAPEGLADDVLAALERRFILDNVAEHQHVASGGRMSRLLTAAAMFLLPVGVLGLIVYQIMKPPAIEPGGPGVVAAQNDNASSNEIAAAALPFDGVLTFRTRQLMTLNSFVEKVLFDHGLMEVAIPEQSPDSATWQLTASPERIVAMLDALKDTWTRSTSVSLMVTAGADAQAVEIPAVRLEQVKSLATQSNVSDFGRMAAGFAAANQQSGPLYAKDNAAEELGPDGLPPVSQPILTGRYTPAASNADEQRQLITLRIHVERSAE